MSKNFLLRKDQITAIALGHDGCIATDRIVVDGCQVGYMYREAPKNGQDSGWRFFAGDENDAYMADLSKHGIYDVNTIANYDPDVVRYLDAPIGAEFERNKSGYLVPV